MAVEREWTRRLAWEGCLNARDLGGYPTEDGRETRWGAIVRSDSLATLSEAGRAALVDYGVRSIIDLRLPSEVEEHPNPFAVAGAHGMAYRNISFVDPAAGPLGDFTSMADNYARMLGRFRPAVGAVMTAIARAPEGGVLVHCMGGKDRTGLISALLLELVGVPRDTIGADYALTGECLRPLDEEWLETGPGDRAEREAMIAKYEPTAEVMLDVLDRLEAQHGGVEAYLSAAGVAAEDLARLKDRLVDPAS